MNFTLIAKIVTLVLAGISAVYGLVFFMIEAKQTDLEHRLIHVEKEIGKGDRFTKVDGDALRTYIDKHGTEISDLRAAVASIATMAAECRVTTNELVYRIRRLENSYYDEPLKDRKRNTSIFTSFP